MRTIISFWKERPGRLIFLVSFTTVQTILVLLFPYLFKDIIDCIKNSFSQRELLNAILVLGIVGFLRSIGGVFLPYTRGRTNEIFNLMERNNIFKIILKQGYSLFSRFPAGDILERMDLDLSELSWFACSGIFRPLEGILTVCFAVYFLSKLNIRLMFISVLPMTISIFAFTFFAPRIYKYFQRWREIISGVHNTLQSNFSGIRIVKAYSLEKQNTWEFRKLLDERIIAAKIVYTNETIL